ncbi:hypothetical protein P4O66_008046 [Electrophorus voltai]|uniref:Fibronectin type-III domain-containing protein n=1 Tax=Electrophorus voltai TaxID=2609070 RepID=A0AAD8ZGK7_9TELE|nr:hypothetical protein P4O66_008046 [Electrophorus voltai]
MDLQNIVVSCLFFLTVHRVWMTELPPPPPQHIQIHSSVLMWNSSGDDRNVTYTVQYSSAPGELWDSMTGCSQLQCDFAAKDFYGKVFRVRAERGNLSSDWQQSEQVQCIHINTCAPIINLSIVSDKVQLQRKHRDSSLKKEYGGHITFRLLYWKTTSPNDKQENNEYTNPIIMNDLEPGKNYCFQFDYLYFHKPYGNPSRLICKEIPETSFGRTLRVIVSGVLTVVVLAIFGGWLYFAYKNYRKIKQYLQPPLDIPQHFQEFLSSEFYEHQVDLPSNQDAEVGKIITFASEQTQMEPKVVDKEKI